MRGAQITSNPGLGLMSDTCPHSPSEPQAIGAVRPLPEPKVPLFSCGEKLELCKPTEARSRRPSPLKSKNRIWRLARVGILSTPYAVVDSVSLPPLLIHRWSALLDTDSMRSSC